jgi:hypothetical protein
VICDVKVQRPPHQRASTNAQHMLSEAEGRKYRVGVGLHAQCKKEDWLKHGKE